MITRLEFEGLVDASLAEVPGKFRDYCDNLVFIVEDRADEQLLFDAGMDSDEELLGYYQGYPLDERSHDFQPLGPDIIYLFQQSIEDEARVTGYPVERVIRETVLHEIAHFFGFSEEEVERIEEIWVRSQA